MGFCLACLFEAGQLFVPGRTCSASDVLIETTGAVAGFLLFRRLLLLAEGRPAIEPSSPAKAGGRVGAAQIKAVPHRWRWNEISPYLNRIAEVARNADVSPVE